MANALNFKIYDPVAQLVATGGGSGGGLPLTGGTLTGNLILTSPSKVIQSQAPTTANDLTNKGYVDSLIGGGPFLPLSGGTMSGQIVQALAPVAPNDVANKAYVDSLIGGGPFLPLTGGTVSGNVILSSPAKLQQNQAPTVGDDLTNKTYTDGAYQAKKPSAVSGNVAFFGSGADAGQVIDSGYLVDTNLTNPPSNTSLWPSSRLIGALQYGANVYKSTASINIPTGSSVKAFSTGNATMGPATWSNTGSTFTLASTGVATIFNSLEYAIFYRIIFSANSLSESTNALGTVECQIQDETGPTFISVVKLLKCLPAPPAFSNEVYLTCLVSIPASSGFNFSVLLTNTGPNTVTVDPVAPSNTCLLVIERVS
ncbi:hypothetical protein IIV30_017L [Invertebrate iridescent virus 30]|uniref:Uncharacterized protein n=1 Tax=Invertebrate iridescent virus 30 TaxID=345585 RepID=W8W1N9_9VIRU|nr:hypothetical protein IIV30_017L [Invertebrate iridescent virus 30]CCV02212.1 hypothetical protein IIV30_017L [Invertebrate iridescent virus 30]